MRPENKRKITKAFIDSLKPEPKSYTVYDTELSGFGVRVGSTSKVYLVQKRIGRKVLKRTIGKHGPFTPDQARKIAQDILYQLNQGQDPLKEKRRAQQQSELTFGRLMEKYLVERKLKPNTVKDYQTKVKRLLADWLLLPANEITRSMARERFDKLMPAHPTQTALVARCASAIFNFAIEYYRDDKTGESEIKQNPIEAVTRGRNNKMPRPKRRDTLIDDSQLPAWFTALEEVRPQHPDLADYLAITLLMGARRTETARLKWVDVDLEKRVVIHRDPKNTCDHYLPLTNHVFDIFQRRRKDSRTEDVFVFPSSSPKSKVGYITEPRYVMAKITAMSGVPFAMHDLRRTFSTAAGELDFHERTIKRMLNHKDDPNNVTLGYIVAEVNRLRKPMQAVEDRILMLGGVKRNEIQDTKE
jgi:integrase